MSLSIAMLSIKMLFEILKFMVKSWHAGNFIGRASISGSSAQALTHMFSFIAF